MRPATWVLIMAVLLVIVAAWPAPDTPLGDTGPAIGDGPTVYLFQAYDCAACHVFTLNGTLDAVLVERGDVRIVWKNVDGPGQHGAAGALCVDRVAPDRFLDWNTFAFQAQPWPGYGWPSQDGLLYQTETHLELDHADTDAFEECFVRDPPSLGDDTAFWKDAGVALPAFYAGGWHPGTVQGFRDAAGL